MYSGIKISAAQNKYDYNENEIVTYSEKIKEYQLLESEIELMTTQELYDEVFQNYPYLMNVFFFDSVTQGLQNEKGNYNVLNELLKRENVGSILLNEYKKVKVLSKDEINKNKLPYKNLLLLEVLLAQENVMKTMSDSEFKTLQCEVIKKYHKKAEYYDAYGPKSHLFFDILKEQSYDYSSWIYNEPTNVLLSASYTTTVHTPNLTEVEVIYRTDSDLTQTDLDTIDEYMETYFPNVEKVGEPTRYYNCHSYAWYSQNITNHYWMNYPKAYYEDGSYELSSGNIYDKICYYNKNNINPTHSGIIVNRVEGTPSSQYGYANLVTVESKWGEYGLYRHNGADSPYTIGESNFDTVKSYSHSEHNFGVTEQDNLIKEHCFTQGCGFEYIHTYSQLTNSNSITNSLNTGEYYWYKFTARVNSFYHFYTQGTTDTYGELYDDLGRLASNDDNGESNNFEFSYRLNSGQSVYLRVRGNNWTSTGNFTVYARVHVTDTIEPLSSASINYDNREIYTYKIESPASKYLRISVDSQSIINLDLNNSDFTSGTSSQADNYIDNLFIKNEVYYLCISAEESSTFNLNIEYVDLGSLIIEDNEYSNNVYSDSLNHINDFNTYQFSPNTSKKYKLELYCDFDLNVIIDNTQINLIKTTGNSTYNYYYYQYIYMNRDYNFLQHDNLYTIFIKASNPNNLGDYIFSLNSGEYIEYSINTNLLYYDIYDLASMEILGAYDNITDNVTVTFAVDEVNANARTVTFSSIFIQFYVEEGTSMYYEMTDIPVGIVIGSQQQSLYDYPSIWIFGQIFEYQGTPDINSFSGEIINVTVEFDQQEFNNILTQVSRYEYWSGYTAVLING